jgi:hypothetical protein
MKFQPLDIVVLILTASICIMLIITILNAAIRGVPLEEGGRKIVGDVILAMVAVISFYAGNQTKKL